MVTPNMYNTKLWELSGHWQVRQLYCIYYIQYNKYKCNINCLILGSSTVFILYKCNINCLIFFIESVFSANPSSLVLYLTISFKHLIIKRKL